MSLNDLDTSVTDVDTLGALRVLMERSSLGVGAAGALAVGACSAIASAVRAGATGASAVGAVAAGASAVGT